MSKLTKIIFTEDELLTQTGITKEMLHSWERKNLLIPDGHTTDRVAFYRRTTINKISLIKQLQELGYEIDDVQKIIKKVGLPKKESDPPEAVTVKEFLTVGELAQRVGVSPRAIKHWEDKGIIEPDMRSEGGFRLYPEIYIYLCNLIKDLQLFGYSLEEIKVISEMFRDFLSIRDNLHAFSYKSTAQKLDKMMDGIQVFLKKINSYKEGIQRWEDLLKKKKKEIADLQNKNRKRSLTRKDSKNA